MALEIERRFLVKGEGWRAHVSWEADLQQAYLLSREDGLTARVRLQQGRQGERAWLTIKAALGPGMPATTRQEFEYPIPADDGRAILQLTPWRVEKRRHGLLLPGGEWVLDVFAGDNTPLVIAEVELRRADDPLVLPPWCATEITGAHALSNAALARHPLRSWDAKDLSALWAGEGLRDS